jgi:tripartite-type tricarboxylate transporter receptor subunit TctC
VRERLTTSGLQPAPVTPEQFRRNIAAEVERWKRVAKESGIRQE